MSKSQPPQISAVHPHWAIEGGRLTIAGSGFPVDRPPAVRVGSESARIALASSTSIAVIVPAGAGSGRTPVKIEGLPGETAYVELGAPVARDVHPVDSPVFDAGGALYVANSGARGEETAVSIFRIASDGPPAGYVTGIVNATSMAFDPGGYLHVSSRFDGNVYRILPNGTREVVGSELGVPCGLAFDAEGTLYVGDRSGTVFALTTSGRTRTFANLPSSVAAFHLAFGPDGWLYVTGPTLNTRDAVYRISPSGAVETVYEGFGRPQGLAFDAHGTLYVAEALAGASGIYRLRDGAAELAVAGTGLVGLAFGPGGALAVASSGAVYRFDAQFTLSPPQPSSRIQ